MSKFNIEGDGNIVGSNNTQNFSKNVHHHNHNHYNNSNNQEQDNNQAIGIIAAAGALMVAAFWWFFQNIDQIYYYLKVSSLIATAPVFLATLVLLYSNSQEKEDWYRFFFVLCAGLGGYFFTGYARGLAPNEIIELAGQLKFMEFWLGLNDVGQKIVISNFGGAFLLGVVIVLNFFIGLRQVTYSFANADRRGFWYVMYDSSKLFKARILGVAIIVMFGLSFVLFQGYLFNL